MFEIDCTVYLNGEYLPLSAARIPVLDRGFIFGDGVYEVIPVYDRRPFRLAEHLARLRHSLAGIRLDDPLGETGWKEVIARIVATAPWPDQGVYLQVTRGVAPRDHAFPRDTPATVFVMPMRLEPPPAAHLEQGVAAISAEDTRWSRCDLKTTSLLANVLLRQLAVDAGCAETLLVRDGQLIEGSASNVFVVHAGCILAPPKSHWMLPGVTYDVVLELAAQLELPHAVRPIAVAEMRAAEEIWLTSSTKEITPVVQLDGHPVGDGRPGPLFYRMHAAYQAFKRDVMRAGESAV